MVNKERLAGLIDAVIAVVMTIMLLEFELPKDGSLLTFLHDNLVYMIAYILSFIYVMTSWFNQQYMLRHAERVTRRIYWACMLWVLSLSLLPILAAWAGRTMNLFKLGGLTAPKAPALLFLLMIYLWGFAYSHMTEAFIKDNPREKAELFRQMEVYQYLHHWIWRVSLVVVVVATWFYPPFVFIYTTGEMVFATVRSRNDREARE